MTNKQDEYRLNVIERLVRNRISSVVYEAADVFIKDQVSELLQRTIRDLTLDTQLFEDAASQERRLLIRAIYNGEEVNKES